MTAAGHDEEFPYEKRLEGLLEELRGHSRIQVDETRLGPIEMPFDNFGEVFKDLVKWYDLPFGEPIREKFFRYAEVEASWRSADPQSELVGEFSLSHVFRSVVENHVSDTWEGKDDEERELYGELRIFDDTPRTGSGRMAALRATRGTTDPEIWFFDMRQGALEMDLDYPAYLDTLLLTKGTIGWQYLFCDAGFGDVGFTPLAKGLQEMVEVIPRLFPQYDYAELASRLRERM
ncbi:hypothetical protein ACFVTP_10545 [Streptomyces celluloflavus]|uniref:hypothetical protein n=1 Tax=Streptomyces celluloflavus TaxID=58344 RepID=UPI0036D7B62B